MVDMHSIAEIIKVKNQADVEVQLNYSLRGPITLIDTTTLKAYAVKCALNWGSLFSQFKNGSS